MSIFLNLFPFLKKKTERICLTRHGEKFRVGFRKTTYEILTIIIISDVVPYRKSNHPFLKVPFVH